MKAVIYLFIFLVGSCGGGTPTGSITNKDSIHWTTIPKDSIAWHTIPKDSIKWRSIPKDSIKWTTIPKDSIHWNIINKDSIHWTTIPKDSVKWNIKNKDTSVVIPLYIDKRLTPYLGDSLKIRFKITYIR